MSDTTILKEYREVLASLPETPPTILLHCCCAPCSSSVLDALTERFRVTVYFYNPNIFPETEYLFRKEELLRYITERTFRFPVSVCDCDYQPQRFFEAAKGLEHEPERGARCEKCFRIRLEETAKSASAQSFDYFCTTLTLSPLKDAKLLNQIGKEYASLYGVRWLPSDFKKENGYLRSLELSKEYQLYRQNYCGCVYSRKDSEQK